MAKSVTGPDFICIGMPKAGTGWFYDQLCHHPDFWMPPAKELHYLSKPVPKLKNSVRLLENWDAIARRGGRHGLAWGERERAFLADAAGCAGQPMDIQRYAALFRHKGDFMSGDTSPGYCTLDDDIVGELATKLPCTKIVLLVREPIARVWSRICMVERDGKFDVSLLDDPQRFADFIRTKWSIYRKSFATEIIRRWSQYYPSDSRFLVVLFDDIALRPAETLRHLLSFLGADPSKAGQVPADYNRKSNMKKLQMPDHIKKVLIDYLGEEVRECASLLGGAARAWPASLGME